MSAVAEAVVESVVAAVRGEPCSNCTAAARICLGTDTSRASRARAAARCSVDGGAGGAIGEVSTATLLSSVVAAPGDGHEGQQCPGAQRGNGEQALRTTQHGEQHRAEQTGRHEADGEAGDDAGELLLHLTNGEQHARLSTDEREAELQDDLEQHLQGNVGRVLQGHQMG